MDIISYALSKKLAENAISGIQSMSVSGQTLTINTKDSGVLTITFPTPKDGVSVTDIDVNANNQIVFTMSDDSEFISGKIPTIKGDPFTYSDFTQEQLDALKGVSPTATVEKVGNIATITITDVNGTTTATISDGQSGGTIDVELTQEEYDALPDTKLTDNKNYFIKDKGNIVRNGISYSSGSGSTSGEIYIDTTLTSGSTQTIVTDSRLKTTSIIDLYTSDFNFEYTNMILEDGSLTIEYDELKSDLNAKVVIRNV